jgi:hypothetical protein
VTTLSQNYLISESRKQRKVDGFEPERSKYTRLSSGTQHNEDKPPDVDKVVIRLDMQCRGQDTAERDGLSPDNVPYRHVPRRAAIGFAKTATPIPDKPKQKLPHSARSGRRKGRGRDARFAHLHKNTLVSVVMEDPSEKVPPLPERYKLKEEHTGQVFGKKWVKNDYPLQLKKDGTDEKGTWHVPDNEATKSEKSKKKEQVFGKKFVKTDYPIEIKKNEKGENVVHMRSEEDTTKNECDEDEDAYRVLGLYDQDDWASSDMPRRGTPLINEILPSHDPPEATPDQTLKKKKSFWSSILRKRD